MRSDIRKLAAYAINLIFKKEYAGLRVKTTTVPKTYSKQINHICTLYTTLLIITQVYANKLMVKIVVLHLDDSDQPALSSTPLLLASRYTHPDQDHCYIG